MPKLIKVPTPATPMAGTELGAGDVRKISARHPARPTMINIHKIRPDLIMINSEMIMISKKPGP